MNHLSEVYEMLAGQINELQGFSPGAIVAVHIHLLVQSGYLRKKLLEDVKAHETSFHAKKSNEVE